MIELAHSCLEAGERGDEILIELDFAPEPPPLTIVTFITIETTILPALLLPYPCPPTLQAPLLTAQLLPLPHGLRCSEEWLCDEGVETQVGEYA